MTFYDDKMARAATSWHCQWEDEMARERGLATYPHMQRLRKWSRYPYPWLSQG